MSRKIEGLTNIYHYLDHLEKDIANGTAPVLIDCLNCESGCNGGTGTTKVEHTMDSLEALINERSCLSKENHRKKGLFSENRTRKKLENFISKYWKSGLYDWSYRNRSGDYDLRDLSNFEMERIYKIMNKNDKEDTGIQPTS